MIIWIIYLFHKCLFKIKSLQIQLKAIISVSNCFFSKDYLTAEHFVLLLSETGGQATLLRCCTSFRGCKGKMTENQLQISLSTILVNKLKIGGC
jgi:hypothetical protein